MARQKLFDTPRITRLQSLIESVQAGELLFPDFQRDFVWSDQQRLRLLDSILMGLPIGSVLVWRTKEDLATKDELLPGIAPDAESPTRNFVLDGLQRLTTLYRALVGVKETGDSEPDVRWPIYFDLEKSLDEGSEDRFHVEPRRGAPPPTWLAMNCLFSPDRLYSAQKRLIESGHDELANKAERLANAFKDYEIPIIPLLTDSLEQAAQSFERVNSQGSNMGQADMLRALTYRKERFDLTTELERITDCLPWDKVDRQVYVNALKVMLDLDVYRAEIRKIAEEIRNRPEFLQQVREAMSASVGFLHDECQIRGQGALPYAYQLVALARADQRLRGKGQHESPYFSVPAADPLRRWFWATTYCEHFSQMTGAQLRKAFAHVEAVCREGGNPIPEELRGWQVQENRSLRGGSVRALAYAHLLARQLAKDEHDNAIDATSIVQWGSRALHKLYLHLPATLPENRFLAPPDKQHEWRRILIDPALPGTYPPTFKEGHLIPTHGSLSSDPEAVLAARRARIQELEGAFVRGLGLEYVKME